MADHNINYANNFIDLTGQKIGRWTVLNRTGKSKRRDPIWICKCECGKIKEVSRNSLRNGSKTCGCLKKENKGRPETVTPVQAKTTTIRGRYRREALNRNLEWDLSKEQFHEMILKPCFYGGHPLSNVQRMKDGNLFFYNGIDRVDNTKGYTPENCVPCCETCNKHKKSITPEIIYKAYHFLFGDKDE